MVAWFETAVTYYLAVIPLLVFIMWTRFGNWYKYDVGWMLMSVDIGLWALDFPGALHKLFGIRTSAEGFQIYYTITTWAIALLITWRGAKIYQILRSGRTEL
jgi:hypothetical protein